VVTEFRVAVPGGELVGLVKGDGPAVLMLHGGPGLSFSYLEGLVEELMPAYRVAIYQQRGLAPSSTVGPFTVEAHVADVEAVLDGLGWPTAHVVGHSWGGYLMLAALARLGDRFLGGLGVDVMGVVGDGGIREFGRTIDQRTPAELRQRANELDHRAMTGEGTDADALESFRLIWPAYFARPEKAPPMPDLEMTVAGYSEAIDSMESGRAALASTLPEVRVPVLLIYGAMSPIPSGASTDLAALMPLTEATAIADAGHYLWMERPGVVRASLDRLVRTHSGTA
jgi:pimeloyl-ACP methyl ester carboxylesterase